MSKIKLNFTPRVLSHIKFRYQEGTEDDVKFLCSNGTLTVINRLQNAVKNGEKSALKILVLKSRYSSDCYRTVTLWEFFAIFCKFSKK